MSDWNEDDEGGSKIGRLHGWEDSAAIEELNEVKREALLNGAIAQGQEMKAFEWVKYTVEAPRARKNDSRES